MALLGTAAPQGGSFPHAARGPRGLPGDTDMGWGCPMDRPGRGVGEAVWRGARSAAALAIAAPGVHVVWTLLAGTVSMAVAYVLPPLMYLRLRPGRGFVFLFLNLPQGGRGNPQGGVEGGWAHGWEPCCTFHFIRIVPGVVLKVMLASWKAILQQPCTHPYTR